MRFGLRAAFVVAVAAGWLSFCPVAWGQTDTRGLVDRLDRLERDLNTLQSQVYRGQSGAAAAAGKESGISGGAYGILDDRISALEEQLRTLTGQVEQAHFAATQLAAKIERMQADNDFRFKELEAKAGTGGAPAAAAPAAEATPTPAPATPPAGPPVGAGSQGMGSPPGFLIHPGERPAPPASTAAPAVAALTPAPPPAGAPPAAKTARDQYDDAFRLLGDRDYDGATRAFQAFVAQHPQDPLAGSATYHLGQIAFLQGHFDQAAVIFLDSYQKYPKSAKAGESLLQVGLSLSKLGKTKEACTALRRFTSEYPDAADSLKRKAASERKDLGC